MSKGEDFGCEMASFHTEMCNIRLFQSPPGGGHPQAPQEEPRRGCPRGWALCSPRPPLRLGPRCLRLSPHLALALAAILLVFLGTYLCAPFQVFVSLESKGSERSTRAAQAQSLGSLSGFYKPVFLRAEVWRKMSSSHFVLLPRWIFFFFLFFFFFSSFWVGLKPLKF